MRHPPDVPFVNKSGERVPPGALMMPGDEYDEDGAVFVTKPDADSLPGLLVNGEFSVEDEAKGGGTFGPQVALAFAGAAPAAGDTLGSEAGSWLAKNGNAGWIAFGGDAADFGLVGAVRDGAGGDASFWVEITGGTDAGGYSGKRVRRTTGNTWADATTPTPLTWASAIYRAPSATVTGLPVIPVGQVVRCWPSPADPTKLETLGVGGRQTKTFKKWRYTCEGGSLVETEWTVTVTGRDLEITES